MSRTTDTAMADSYPRLTSPNLLLEHLGIDEPRDLDVEAIAQACGATIVYETLQGCEARIVGAHNRAIITINADAARPRQRFSAAHELGHWMHDRGKVAFACQEGQFVAEWGKANPERRANRFAVDLLLPRTMFKRRMRHRPVTFATVRELALEFQTSLTATAIRLVELSSYPAVLVCHDRGRRRWFAQSTNMPLLLDPHPTLRPGSAAFQLFQGAGPKAAVGPKEVATDLWIPAVAKERPCLMEDSVMTGGQMTLSLLWWHD